MCHFAVNSYLNCSYLHLYLQFYYTAVAVTPYRVRVSKSTGRPNFIHIGPPATKIWRLIDIQTGSHGGYFRFWKTYLDPPYWNCSSGCDFDHIAVIGMPGISRVSNLIQIAPPAADVDFKRRLPLRLNTTSGFSIVDVTSSENQILSSSQMSST